MSDPDAAVSAVEAERALALALVLRHLERRMRSRGELASYLYGRGVRPEAALAAIENAERLGYVDDRAYARAFTSDRVRLAPRGYARIAAELRARGISREDAEAAVREAEAETPEPELARSLLARRTRRLEGLEPRAARRRAGTWLRGRGFRSGTILSVLESDGGPWAPEAETPSSGRRESE